MRAYNFSPGPAVLPLGVLQQAREELLEWNSGMSVMEVSHRGAAFVEVAEQAESDLRELMAIPSGYQVLFMQGGASAQFSLIPMNLALPGETMDLIDTGHWSRKASDEARRYGPVHIAGDAGEPYLSVPKPGDIRMSERPAYLHYTPNETISGVEFDYVPDSGRAPLVADMSSSILSRPVDVSRFALIYAGAQKNIGPSGLTVVIVREDLLGRARPETPTVFNFQAVARERSMLNTPPTFAWYMAGLVFKWLKAAGGIARMAENNQRKSQLLYQMIDASSLYRNSVARDARSRMNVTFALRRPELDVKFLAEAAHAGLHGLKGHRVFGGMRASLYNALPLEAVERLTQFMQDFESRHG